MGQTLIEQVRLSNSLTKLLASDKNYDINAFGNDLYVDTVGGSDSNVGNTKDTAFKTMAAAFAAVKDYGRIFVVGTIAEELLTPLGVQGVKIVGAANGNTRHDNGVRWKEPAANPTIGGALLTIREQGWELHNILFVPKTDGTAVRLRRAEDATYPDGSHAIIKNCKFIGNVAFGAQGGVGVEDHGGSHHDRIEECEFVSLTSAIKSTAGAGIAAPLRWIIKNCLFLDNTNNIVLPGNQCLIQGNVMDAATVGINTSGATGNNFVLDNVFQKDAANITNAGGFTAHATDVWRNFSQNTAAVTVGVPGA